MIYEFKGIKPVIHESAFIHPLAAVTGHVIIGKDVYIGPGAAIRGDWGKIVIEDGPPPPPERIGTYRPWCNYSWCSNRKKLANRDEFRHHG